MHRKLWYKTHQNLNVSYVWTSPNRAQFLGWHTVPSRHLKTSINTWCFVWRVKEISDSRTGRRALAHAQVERTWGAGRSQDWHSTAQQPWAMARMEQPLFSLWHCSQPSAWTDSESWGARGSVCVRQCVQLMWSPDIAVWEPGFTECLHNARLG